MDISKLTRNMALASDDDEGLSPDEVNEVPLQLSQDESTNVVEKGVPETPETEDESEEIEDVEDSQPDEDEDEIADEESTDEKPEVKETPKTVDRTLKYKVGNQEREFVLDDGDVFSENTRKFVTQMLAKEGLEIKTQQAVERAKNLEQIAETERTKAKLAQEQWEDVQEYMPLISMFRADRDALKQVELWAQQKLPQFGWKGHIQDDSERRKLERQNRDLQNRQFAIDANNMKSQIANELCNKYKYGQDEMSAIDELMREQGMGVVIPGIPLDVQRQVIQGQAEMARELLIARGKLQNPDVAKLAAEKAAVEGKLQQARKVQAIKNPGVGGSAAVQTGTRGKSSSWKDIPESEIADIMREKGRQAWENKKRKG